MNDATRMRPSRRAFRRGESLAGRSAGVSCVAVSGCPDGAGAALGWGCLDDAGAALGSGYPVGAGAALGSGYLDGAGTAGAGNGRSVVRWNAGTRDTVSVCRWEGPRVPGRAAGGPLGEQAGVADAVQRAPAPGRRLAGGVHGAGSGR